MSSQPLLPPELEFRIFQSLDLAGLIKASCVCQRWRSAIVNEPNLILPQRLALLQLYKDTIASPKFLPGRTKVLPRLLEKGVFDRAEFMARITALFPECVLPEEFVLWVTEWPERACNRIWPGLRHDMMWPDSPYSRCWLESTAKLEDARTEMYVRVKSGDDEEEIYGLALMIWTWDHANLEALLMGRQFEALRGAVDTAHVNDNGSIDHDLSNKNWVEYLYQRLAKEHGDSGTSVTRQSAITAINTQ